jgi:ubiquinone/menaquinone biosynthesis C-methylase UbiE
MKSGHTLYVERVKEQFQDGCCWLDAGGGHRIFHDAYDGEAELVNRASFVVVCDADNESLRNHESVANRVCCDLSNLPFSPGTFNFVTCGMVIEHLSDPKRVFLELSRCMQSGGKLIVHTPNLFGHATILAVVSKLLPSAFRKSLIAKVTGRNELDIFETFYRANTRRSLCSAIAGAGFTIERIELLQSRLFQKIPLLRSIEMAYIRLIQLPGLAFLRAQLLILAKKCGS